MCISYYSSIHPDTVSCVYNSIKNDDELFKYDLFLYKARVGGLELG